MIWSPFELILWGIVFIIGILCSILYLLALEYFHISQERFPQILVHQLNQNYTHSSSIAFQY